MKKTDQTKMEQWETSGKKGKKPTKSKKSKESEPLTEEQLEKLPKLPKDWKWVSHSEIAIINPPKPTGDESLEISFLPMPAVEEETGRYSLSETRKLGEVRKGYTGFIEGDVIFAKITPCMENGKVALLEKLVNGIGFGSTEFHVSRPISSVSGKYLFHYLVQQIFRKEAKRSMTGSAGQLRVSTNYFAEQPFPLAPLPEQRAIVSKIELLFSELDNGISNLKLAQEQLKVYRQAVLKKAFEGELTKKWREQQTDLPDAGDLLEQSRKEREEAAKASGKKLKKVKALTEAELVELPRIPEEWIWTNINQICFLDVGFAFKSSEFVDEGIRLLRGDNIEPGSLRWENTKCLPKEKIHDYKNLIVEKDEIILAMDRPLISSGLKLAMAKDSDVPCLLVQRMARFRPISVDNKYLYYSLQTKNFIHHLLDGQTGTQLPHVSETNISSFIFSLPPLAEQKLIVKEIELRLSVCDKIEQDIKENLEKAEALRQSILKKAFEGKLLNERELAEVRGTEDWEPAEVLLERVKAERTANGKSGEYGSAKIEKVA